MAIDDLKGDGGAVAEETPAAQDPEAVRRAEQARERAAELARLTAAFEERMAVRPDVPATTAAEGTKEFNPKPLEKTEALAILGQARELLSGSRKLEYFNITTAWGGNILRGLPDYAQSLVFVRGILKACKKFRNRLHELFAELILDPETGHSSIICLLHWLYFKEHFRWALKDLTPDEKAILETLEPHLQKVLFAVPEATDMFIGLGEEQHDIVLCESALVARSRGMPDFSDERLLRETAFTGNDFQFASRWLNLESDDIRGMTEGDVPVLDLGCGLSDFSAELRRRGVQSVYTLDDLSIEEMIAKVRGMKPAVAEGLGVVKALRKLLGEDRGTVEQWHRKGSAQDTNKIFGDGFFKRIFGVDSITQPALCPVYRKDPMAFWENMNGPLRALSPQQGELRLTTNPYILYSQTDMEAYWLPFLMAMRAGRFEIPGPYGDDGVFLFEKFMDQYVRWKPEKSPPLRVRRHPVSNPDAADRFMQKALAKGASLEKICAEMK